jgi:hypothetical protein
LSLKRIVLAPNEARVARLGRYFLPDQPLHVIQHGNNRQAIFFCEDDHRRLRAWLAEAAAAHHCARYAAESQIAPATVNGSPAQAAHLYFLSSGAAPPPNSLLPSGASYANASTCSGATGAATSRRRLSAKYTFATKMGAFSVSNYDGQSFMVSGKATTAAGGTQYSVPIAGGINGSFYGPMAAETGGNFNFHTTAGPTYLTSGIFAAKR